MCDYECFKFTCNCETKKLLSYCHFARNDPYHQCFDVDVIRNTFMQSGLCPGHVAQQEAAATQQRLLQRQQQQRR
ncbi:uncharacterized protein RSE6_11591 [Rhynchosporium secalis]|uniref:Uncharacterized protein n=1 Tax=Rhynchosporium secalis TaxID=38038 RepID=A0A1E1MNB2_RHYSE|nr:uncharacterized protein RSE6_11591 [Rhynchosporium secalis]